jgi:hypothetical protein
MESKNISHYKIIDKLGEGGPVLRSPRNGMIRNDRKYNISL